MQWRESCKSLISTQTSSQTAMACEQAALFSATPGPDEFDNREIWNVDEALAGIEEAIHILAGTVAPDGTQLADERESLLWGFVNTLHAQVQRLDRGVSTRSRPEMKDLQPRAGRLRDQVAANSNASPTGSRTSATVATPSRPCATSPPRDTVS